MAYRELQRTEVLESLLAASRAQNRLLEEQVRLLREIKEALVSRRDQAGAAAGSGR